MFAYIDETGNTGENIFDPAQPVFMTAALMTRGKFDLLYKDKVGRLARDLGTDILHSNQLGIGRIEEIASPVLKILRDARASFIISRVVKADLAATKFVDTIFDSGENLAVPWQSYNLRPLRLFLVMKVVALLDEKLLREFWAGLMESNKETAYKKISAVLDTLLLRINVLPDARSRELISEAICWALKHPEAIHWHSNSKASRYGHLPNIASFSPLLGGISMKSKIWDVGVDEIVHDRQSQFGTALKEMHELYSNALPDELHWPFEEPISFQFNPGSIFRISESGESAGIQIIDIILWLFKKIDEGHPLPVKSSKLMSHVMKNSYLHDLSLQNISNYLSDFMTHLEEAPITEQQMLRAKELLLQSEQRRKEAMMHYESRKTIL